jgi:hypothetical protein
MKPVQFAAVVLGLLLCVFVRADQLEAQKLLDEGKYSEAVAKADVELRNRNITPEDQYSLLMLKGEAALRAGQKPLATSSFNAAARAATNRKDAISAAANSLVAQRMVQGVVTIDDQSYPIATLEQRKVAMQKMADEIMTKDARNLKTALEARTLGPIIDVAPAVWNMCVLEMEATGGNSQNAEPVARSLGKQSQDLIAVELRRLQRDLDYTEQNAYELYTWTGWTARGLTPAQRQNLQETVPYVNRILRTVLNARRVAIVLGGDIGSWDRLAAECDDLSHRLDIVLTRTY